MTRAPSRSQTLLAAALAAVMLAAVLLMPGGPVGPADAGAKTLKKGKVRVKAPRGFRLRVRNGVVSVRNKRFELTMARIKTPLRAIDLARHLFASAGGSQLGEPPDPQQFGIRVKGRRGTVGELGFSRGAETVAVTALGPRGRTRSRKRKASSAAIRKKVSRRDRSTAARIARSARGLPGVDLPGGVTREPEPLDPLKPFTSGDGSTKGNVPAGPGWDIGGDSGSLYGFHPRLGEYAFGFPAGFFRPGTCYGADYCSYSQHEYVGARDALISAFPQRRSPFRGATSNVQILQTVPGSVGNLGPGYDSAMFEATFSHQGQTRHGFFNVGTAQIDENSWILYMSYIAVVPGDPTATAASRALRAPKARASSTASLGAALFEAWKSWDPSADQRRRLQETFISQQQTSDIILGSNDYRRAVYEKTNYNWSKYIREGGNADLDLNPVVGSLAPFGTFTSKGGTIAPLGGHR